MSTSPPRLLVVVDTEEEFNWHEPVSTRNRSVTNVTAQPRAHDIFQRYRLVPTYVVDHPVVSDEAAVATLSALREDGKADIGAHLHPWVNPPYQETVSVRTSYPGNLPDWLEYAKLEKLTEAITAAFGERPVAYRAGRYGLGPATFENLRQLGYKIDTSVVPFTSFARDGGPDFRCERRSLTWRGHDRSILEVPLTVGFCGCLSRLGGDLYPQLATDAGMTLRLPGIASRAGLLERIRLTPEGTRAGDLVRLARALIREGETTFVYSYHSPSMVPGHTPYVRTENDLSTLLSDMDAFFEAFFTELGGVPTTLHEVHADAQREVPTTF
jgi:hypothetical protein